MPSKTSSPSVVRAPRSTWPRAAHPPRWLTPVPSSDLRRSDTGGIVTGKDAIWFVENFCRVTKDSVAADAGSPLQLRDWQQLLIRHLYARRADRRLRHRTALIGVARKNGKSALSAGLGLHGLLTGPAGGEVYCCAADKKQAKIVFGTGKRMVEMNPDLREHIKPYADALEFTKTGSVWQVLSAEAFTKEGLNPHLVIFDEVHAQPNRELWDVMALAMGARPEPLMVGITTAGVRSDSSGQDSLCYGLYQYGRRVASGEIDDPTFFMAWWEPADPESDHRLVSTWHEANPGYDDLLAAEDFQSAIRRTPEPEFRTKRCNQWVSTTSAWLPYGAWSACAQAKAIPDFADVVLGFDGSFNNDSTALIAVSIEDVPHVEVVACWERPFDADDSWRVPIADVEDAIRDACRRFTVAEVLCDPFRWARTIQTLEDEGLPMVEFPQTPSRMMPATQRFYEAVLNGGLTQSGDARLNRHIDNCTLKVDARGARLAKDQRNSPRKIDLAVAAVMAFDTAAELSASNVEPMIAFDDDL
jgi:phage terminase large subunit-like protein